MTSQPITSSRPAPGRHRRVRTAAAITAIAALIAAGGYLTTTIGPNAAPRTPATGADVNPSAQTLRDIVQSVAGQYGSRSAAGAAVNASAQTKRELHESIAGQYGPAR